MKVSITKDELLKALSIVAKGMSSRSTLPILSGIFLSASGKELTFQTTDLEISIRCVATAFIEEEGTTVIPGKIFSDIVRNLPDAAVQLTTDGSKVVVECMNSLFTLNTLNANDFPAFPEVQANQEIVLPTVTLSNMVRQVAKSVSKDESRAVLTGTLLSISQGTMRLVATDSYRLAVSEVELNDTSVEDIEVIVPGQVFDDIMKSAATEEKISIGVADNQIVFTFGSTVFITRKIEGKYPNYRQLIPSEKNTSITVDTAQFVQAVRRVALLAQSHTPLKFIFSAENQSVEIVSQAQDVGGADESLPAQVEGETVQIGFNHQYIIDGFASIGTEKTLVEVQSSLKPGIFKSIGDENFLYLVMPVRLG